MTVAQLALAQPPKKYRRGRRALIRADSAGGTHDFVGPAHPVAAVAVLPAQPRVVCRAPGTPCKGAPCEYDSGRAARPTTSRR